MHKFIRNIIQTTVACLALLVLSQATTVHADTTVATQFQMPLTVSTVTSVTECDNSPGPIITLSGQIVMGGLSCDLIFQNNVKGTHTTTVTFTTNISLVVAGGAIVIPKQPVDGGTGGNPYIWIQFLDGNDNALTDQIFLGRCVQGLAPISPSMLAAVLASLDLSVANCANNPGPTITVSGGISFSAGVKARFFFQNADNPVGGPHQAMVTRDVTLLGANSFVQIPKQPVLGGAGGNPLIWVQFRQGNGDPIGDPIFLGRCVQMN